MTKVLHRITTWNDGTEYHFASIDGGKYWIELDRPPTQDDHDSIQALLNGTYDPDTEHTTFPIRVANRYFGTMSPNFTVSEAETA